MDHIKGRYKMFLYVNGAGKLLSQRNVNLFGNESCFHTTMNIHVNEALFFVIPFTKTLLSFYNGFLHKNYTNKWDTCTPPPPTRFVYQPRLGLRPRTPHSFLSLCHCTLSLPTQELTNYY